VCGCATQDKNHGHPEVLGRPVVQGLQNGWESAMPSGGVDAHSFMTFGLCTRNEKCAPAPPQAQRELPPQAQRELPPQAHRELPPRAQRGLPSATLDLDQ